MSKIYFELKISSYGSGEGKISAFSDAKQINFSKVRFTKYWFSADRNLDMRLDYLNKFIGLTWFSLKINSKNKNYFLKNQ